jgi:hypothetical protein
MTRYRLAQPAARSGDDDYLAGNIVSHSWILLSEQSDPVHENIAESPRTFTGLSEAHRSILYFPTRSERRPG